MTRSYPFILTLLALGSVAKGQAPATITYPTNHATVSSPTLTVTWTIGASAADYFLYLGTYQGANDVFAADEGLKTNQVVSNLPNGTIWVRLWTRIGSTWHYNDTSFTETGGSTPASLTNPANASTVSNPSVTLIWSPGSGATGFFLYAGTTQGGNNLFAKDMGLSTSQVVNNLPNGTIWVRLWTAFGTSWRYNDYSFTEKGGAAPATLTSPTNHSDIIGGKMTFQWTKGSAVSDYFLYIGSSQGQSDLFAKDEGGSTLSQTISSLRAGTVWVRLWSLVGSSWYFNDYSFTVFPIGNDYLDQWKTADYSQVNPATGFYYRNCTDYVAWRLNRDKGITSPAAFWFKNSMPGQTSYWSDASNWKQHATDNHYVVDSKPAVGAVAFFDYGHVAYVESVNQDGTVNLSEYNYSPAYGHQYGVRHNVSDVTKFIHIIH